MLRHFVLLMFLFLVTGLSAQTYSYSFKGELTNEQSQHLTEDIKAIKHILTVDVRFKPEKQMGELIFSVDALENQGENDHPFSPVDVKAVLIRLQLEPVDFRQIK